ncbi:Aste57867_16896 [Aphanomyces stellatus]|uniref:Aste57867_16896 protein n=1 Tax=Aphanomyces stellatus TaxID=120398 RepID=A0A485L9N7_9STRA|nr:hypothetical protein As57867_016838 [Aphanomyces stellatus]VFT93659.1 Aste57867_16896 [Aphanomyces stellatus]
MNTVFRTRFSEHRKYETNVCVVIGPFDVKILHQARTFAMPLERLSHELIAEIAREFPTLSNLNLSKNAIREMECDLSMLPYVSRLNLSHNQLSTLPQSLHAHLPQLTQLLLAHNRFTTLESLQTLSTLTVLDLASNDIAHIDQLDYLQSLPLLTDLQIQGNPKLDALAKSRLHVLARLPRLQVLDQIDVTPQEREAARRLLPANPLPVVPPFATLIPNPLVDRPLVALPTPPVLSPPPPPSSSKQIDLMQNRITALQELIALQEAAISTAAASPTDADATVYHKLLATWRAKVYDLLLALQTHALSAKANVHEAHRATAAVEQQVAERTRREASLAQRLADADAARQLLQLQLDQVEGEKAALAVKCSRQASGLETERSHTRTMAHHVIALVQDDAAVAKLQHMYARVSHHDQRLQRHAQQLETLVVSLARKEARLRNQEAALEGERRVWIKRLQSSGGSPEKKPIKSTIKLKPETESVLRAVFQRLDPYHTGMVESARWLQALQKDWTVRQAMGTAGQEKLIAAIAQNELFAKAKHVTWGEFVLLFLPDLSPPSPTTTLDVSCQDNGVPTPFELDERTKPTKKGGTDKAYNEWSRDQLEDHVRHLEQERTMLLARLREDARDLQARVRRVHQAWETKCDGHVQSLAALQETTRDQDLRLTMQRNAQTYLESQVAELRAQSAQKETEWSAQVQQLQSQVANSARDHGRAVVELQEEHVAAVQELELQVRQAQKNQLKQDVYIRQLERQVKRLQDAAADEEKEVHESLTRQLERRDMEIAKLNRERNALLSTVREQEKKPRPLMVDQGTCTDRVEQHVVVDVPPPQPSTPFPPQTKTIPKLTPVPRIRDPVPQVAATLDHRLAALSSQASRWLSDDEWCSSDDDDAHR